MPLKGLGISMIVIGAILLVYGVNASESVTSSISKFFTGHPTDKAVWFLIGGLASLIVGACISFAPARRGVG